MFELPDYIPRPKDAVWHERLLWMALVSAFIGFAIGAYTDQWHWFARSGALIVVFGIILTGETLMASQRRFTEGLKNLNADDKDVQAAGSRSSLYRHEIDRWFGEMLGFYMLIVGTLIWGFGDLLQLIPVKWGE